MEVCSLGGEAPSAVWEPGKEHDEHSTVHVYFPDASSQKKTSDLCVSSGKSDSSRPLFVEISAGAYHSLALQGIAFLL